MKTDIRVQGGLGLYLLRPETDAGREWLDRHVQIEAWQRRQGGVVVEGRELVTDIVRGALDEGLTVK